MRRFKLTALTALASRPPTTAAGTTFRILCWLLVVVGHSVTGQTVAVIGGGIAGTFTTKYLVDFDRSGCRLDSITLFDPRPIGRATVLHDDNNNHEDEGQGSRVASGILADGKVVELGASVFHGANELIREMIANDPDHLTIGPPFNVGHNDSQKVPTRAGLGIYHGNGDWKFWLNNTDPWTTYRTVVRYNWDLYKIARATQKAIGRFSDIPALLDSTHPKTFFESPDQMWAHTKLIKLVHVSFDRLLDAMWVTTPQSWKNQYMPYQGSIRRELLSAINLINYNQGNSQLNGLVGLVSFAASKGPLHSVVGGNHQILQSAFRQAQTNRRNYCPHQTDTVTHRQLRVTTVIGRIDGFELFAGTELIGIFDTVVLAAPLQQSGIRFVIPSPWDAAVLQPMPLGRDSMVDPDQVPENHEGHAVLPGKLPGFATRPYTQVVTTVVRGATLNHSHFHLSHPDRLPRAVCTTERGKARESNITVISQITGDGVFKVFSSDPLHRETLVQLFGPDHTVQFEKVWGGPQGGATPDYQGGGASLGYLLYDGATGMEGHTNAGALYYPNAIESSLACMEASAIGAKSVAKLVARRLDLLSGLAGSKHDGEEL